MAAIPEVLHKLFSRPLNHQQTTQARAEKNVSAIAVVKTRIYRFCSSNCIKCSLKDTCASTTSRKRHHLSSRLWWRSSRMFIDTSAGWISCNLLNSINNLIKIRFFRNFIMRGSFMAGFMDVNVLLALKRFQSSRFCLFKARRKFILFQNSLLSFLPFK